MVHTYITHQQAWCISAPALHQHERSPHYCVVGARAFPPCALSSPGIGLPLADPFLHRHIPVR